MDRPPLPLEIGTVVLHLFPRPPMIGDGPNSVGGLVGQVIAYDDKMASLMNRRGSDLGSIINDIWAAPREWLFAAVDERARRCIGMSWPPYLGDLPS